MESKDYCVVIGGVNVDIVVCSALKDSALRPFSVYI